MHARRRPKVHGNIWSYFQISHVVGAKSFSFNRLFGLSFNSIFNDCYQKINKHFVFTTFDLSCVIQTTSDAINPGKYNSNSLACWNHIKCWLNVCVPENISAKYLGRSGLRWKQSTDESTLNDDILFMMSIIPNSSAFHFLYSSSDFEILRSNAFSAGSEVYPLRTPRKLEESPLRKLKWYLRRLNKVAGTRVSEALFHPG